MGIVATEMNMDGSERSNRCSHCGKEFSMRSSLKVHEREHRIRGKPHKCDVCGKHFTFKASLKTHVLQHAPEVPYDCLICGRIFKEKCDFKNHVESHDNENAGEYSYSEELVDDKSCEYKSATTEELVDDKSCEYKSATTEAAYQGTNLGICILEMKETPFIKSNLKKENPVLERSLLKKEGVKVDSVASANDDLKSDLSSENILERHPRLQESSHSNNKNHIRCPICKDTFPSEDSLKRHGDTETQQCQKCEKFYSSCLNLKLHRKSHTLSMNCKVCDKRFTRKQSLRRHELSHVGDQKCSLCEKICANKRALRLHMSKMHRESRKVNCKECGQKVKRCDLSEHKLAHRGYETHQCQECGVTFSELYKLKNHVKFHKHRKANLDCVICGRTLSTKKALESHSLTHTGEQECTICGITLSNAGCLRRHILSAHEGKHIDKKSERRVQCDVCGNMYGRSYIETHLRIHAGQKDFNCNQCGKNFVSRANLREHQMIHDVRKRYSCNFCDKKFSSRKNLVIHSRKHTGETPHQCTVCSKTFVTSWTLKNHLRLHDLEEAFSCDICGKKFSQKKSLFAHYAGDAHSKEELQQLDPKILNSISKKYQCTLCGKNCYEKTMLTFHMRTHTGEKPYKCTECGKAFRVESALKVHMKFHTGDLRFECAVCKKPFPHQSQAVKHELLHNGEKPHLCTICGKAFFTKNNLKLHVERHALKTVYACGTCGQEFTVKRKCMAHQKSCMYPTIASSQMSESGSLDDSNVIEYYDTMNNMSSISELEQKKDSKEQSGKNEMGEGTQSIECSEYLYDFDVESSQTQVTFSLSEDVDCIKEELVVLEIDPLEFRCKDSV